MRTLSLLVVVPLVACAPDLPFEPASPEAAPVPSTFGPYPVGVRTMTFVDDTRAAPPPLPEGPRTLIAEIWYPAVEAARGRPGVEYVLYDEIPEDQREGLSPEDLGSLPTIAVRDAEPRVDEKRGTFPLIVFSHGQGGVRMQSTFYTVMLASHGYVVVSPDHQGDTIVDVMKAGDVEIDTAARSFIERPLDVVFMMNAIDFLPASDPLRAAVDMQRIGVTGHSFGAFTSLAVGGQNVGVDVVVAQAPVGVGAVETSTDKPLEEFGIPVMIQSSGEDRILPAETHAQSLWDHMVTPRAWTHLIRGGHFTYSDLCVLDVAAIDAALDIDASNVLDDGCGFENTPTDVAFPLINNAAIGFFNLHLRESAGSASFITQAESDSIAAGEGTVLIE